MYHKRCMSLPNFHPGPDSTIPKLKQLGSTIYSRDLFNRGISADLYFIEWHLVQRNNHAYFLITFHSNRKRRIKCVHSLWPWAIHFSEPFGIVYVYSIPFSNWMYGMLSLHTRNIHTKVENYSNNMHAGVNHFQCRWTNGVLTSYHFDGIPQLC